MADDNTLDNLTDDEKQELLENAQEAQAPIDETGEVAKVGPQDESMPQSAALPENPALEQSSIQSNPTQPIGSQVGPARDPSSVGPAKMLPKAVPETQPAPSNNALDISKLLKDRSDALEAARNSNIGEKLIQAGEEAGGNKYTPSTAGADFFKNKADLALKDVTDRPLLNEADPGSDVSQTARNFLAQKGIKVSPNASFSELKGMFPALRSLGTPAKAQQSTYLTKDGKPVIFLNGKYYKNNSDGSTSEVSSEDLHKVFAPKNILNSVTGLNQAVQGTTSGAPKVYNLNGPGLTVAQGIQANNVYGALDPKQRILIDKVGSDFARETAKDRTQLDKANSIAKEVNLALTNPAAKTELSVRLGQYLTGGKVTQGEALGLFLHRGGVLNKVNDYLQEMQGGTLVPQHAQELIQVFNQYAQDTKKQLQNRADEKANLISNKIPGFQSADLAPIIYGNYRQNKTSLAPRSSNVRVKAPDGSIRLVPKDQLDAAIKNGGKLAE